MARICESLFKPDYIKAKRLKIRDKNNIIERFEEVLDYQENDNIYLITLKFRRDYIDVEESTNIHRKVLSKIQNKLGNKEYGTLTTGQSIIYPEYESHYIYLHTFINMKDVTIESLNKLFGNEKGFIKGKKAGFDIVNRRIELDKILNPMINCITIYPVGNELQKCVFHIMNKYKKLDWIHDFESHDKYFGSNFIVFPYMTKKEIEKEEKRISELPEYTLDDLL